MRALLLLGLGRQRITGKIHSRHPVMMIQSSSVDNAHFKPCDDDFSMRDGIYEGCDDMVPSKGWQAQHHR